MRRVRRQTIRRGNVTGRQRRRLAARLRDVHRTWGPGCFTSSAPAIRDARRLAEAGLAVAITSKYRPWCRGGIGEVSLFRTMSKALERYQRIHLLPGRYQMKPLA